MAMGSEKRVWLSMLVLSALLLAIILGSLAFETRQIKSHYNTVAREMGRAFFTELVIARRWNAMHGGVYAPVTEDLQPNEFLVDPLRDVITTDGLKLTKINPAFMTRLVSELTSLENGISFHITSLRPLNPVNQPDEWEKKSLEQFNAGAREAFEVREKNGFGYFTYMGRLDTEAGCLLCHAKDGYRLGDVRGGISVSVPFAPFVEAMDTEQHTALWTNGVIALFGLLAIFALGTQLARNAGQLEGANRNLAEANVELRERAAELRQLNELKNKFLGIAAHDLRNPLTAIRGMSEMIMLLELKEEKKKDLVNTINQASDHMLFLLNDLLDVSTIESGAFALKLEPGNLAEVVESRIRLMGVNAEPKNIRLTTEIRGVPEVAFDRERMIQVIDNLLSNAVKFSPPDTTVHVTMGVADGSVRFSVRDQGPGIPAAELDKLFLAFEKLSVRPTGGEKSTGLGLAIVKRIVDAHSGEVLVESEVGAGSTFTVSLPLKMDS